VRREAQRLRFGPWLLSAVSSGRYPGLCWIDKSRGIFRVPWKHNARKDITTSDVEIFRVGEMRGRGHCAHPTCTHQAWARVSGRYEGYPEDPAKWKTNFRCALTSTRMFEKVEDNSKRGDDPHKVF
ncbi:IRF3 factor, partial [Turnix velox]|nr:IRF3 factor [Turnix velox]